MSYILHLLLNTLVLALYNVGDDVSTKIKLDWNIDPLVF